MDRWACVARLGGIGDNLIAASVLKPLKQLGYKVEVLTSEPFHVVFHHNPHIDRLAVKNADRDLPKNDLAAWQQWFKSRSEEYDVFAHLSHSCEGRHAVFPAMTAFWWPPDYRRKLCGGSYLETAHDIAGVPYSFGPLYFTSEQERVSAGKTKEPIGRFIGWVLSGTRIDKIYPYAALAVARLVREVGPVVLFGGGGEKEIRMAHAIQDHVELVNGSLKGLHSAMSEAGTEEGGAKNWPIRRSLALLHAANVVVAPDTGPAWAVAFERMPKVIMVSHASAENITKHWLNTITLHADPMRVGCWPCHRLHDTPETCTPNRDNNGAACMTDISVETVIKTVKDVW